MKVVVIGGTGLVGSKVVAKLKAHEHEVVPASPSSGVDTITGEGLALALAGASVVIDLSNAPSSDHRAAIEFFETSTRHLLAAEETAHVSHHVALSLVGTDRLAEGGDPATTIAGYFRAKVIQEGLIKASPVPWTIVHATQSFESITKIADSATTGNTVRLPPVSFQPMAADDVAQAICQVALGLPIFGITEVAGPERFRLDGAVERILSERDDPREVLTDVDATYLGARVLLRSLIPAPGACLGEIHLDDWLKQTTPARWHPWDWGSGEQA